MKRQLFSCIVALFGVVFLAQPISASALSARESAKKI